MADVLSWDYYPSQPRYSEIHPWWDNPGGCTLQVEVHHPTIAKGDYELEQEVHVAAGHVSVLIHMTDWAGAQREDPVLNAQS